MTQLKLLIDPLRAALAEDDAPEAFVLLRAQAPLPPPEVDRPRNPLHLAVVIDRSGSMSGRPLREAKACAQRIIRMLTPRDQVAVVVYDDAAQVLIPCQPVENPEVLCRVIDPIRSGGSTNLHDGWALGVGELRKALGPESHSQVLVLSDGQANQGIHDPERLAAACAKARGIGIGTSTYGLGTEFDERLMTAMAAQGQGRAYYGEDAEDLMEVFEDEFAFLSDLFAPEARLELEAGAGVGLKVLNPYPMTGATAWVLPSLPYAGEAWAVLRLRPTAAALASRNALGEVPLFRAGVTWKGRDGAWSSLEPVEYALPVLPSERVQALPGDPQVELRLRDLNIAEIHEQIYQAALEGRWDAVRELLDGLKGLAGEDPVLRQMVQNMETMATIGSEALLRKEAHYATFAFSSDTRACIREDDAVIDSLPRYFAPKTSFGKRKKPKRLPEGEDSGLSPLPPQSGSDGA